MGRPQNPILHDGPAAEFAQRLRDARHAAGNKPYREMAEMVHFSGPALSTAAAGKRLPTWDVTFAYLSACGVSEAELEDWRTLWEDTDARLRQQRLRDRYVPLAPADLPAVPISGMNVLPTLPTRLAEAKVHDLWDRLSEVRSEEEYRAMLQELRKVRALSIRAVSARSRVAEMPRLTGTAEPKLQWLSPTAIQETLNGGRAVTVKFVRLYVNACGGDAADIDMWTSVWQRIQRQERASRALSILTNAEPYTAKPGISDEESPSRTEPRIAVHNYPQPDWINRPAGRGLHRRPSEERARRVSQIVAAMAAFIAMVIVIRLASS